MGLDDMLKCQLQERLSELKPKLVQEFKELTDQDVDEAGNDPDQIVDKIQQKTASRASRSSSACVRSLRRRPTCPGAGPALPLHSGHHS
jgi:hypothetical protein